MTLSGLICGREITLKEKPPPNIIGISIARNAKKALAATNKYIFAYLQKTDASNTYDIIENYGNGYGCYDKKTLLLIRAFLAKTGIALDPNYTGKGFAGMLNYIQNKNIQGANILFIHTGGLPLFFDSLKESIAK